VTCIGVWILAERLGLSAVLSLVAFAMAIARSANLATRPRIRIHSFAVWGTAVFLLNVLAFLLMGLQARSIVGAMAPDRLREAAWFAAAVVLCLIVVRMAWVLIYNRLASAFRWLRDQQKPATLRHGVLVGWCGMRGLVTLVVAIALPADFPHRDPIVLAAFAVVLGTLVLQGMTLKPLLRWINFAPDRSVDNEVAQARVAVMQAALDVLSRKTSAAAAVVREQYEAQRVIAENPDDAQAATEYDRLRLYAINRQRDTLEELRRNGTIGDEAYHRLEEEIDWAELAASPAGRFQPLTTD